MARPPSLESEQDGALAVAAASRCYAIAGGKTGNLGLEQSVRLRFYDAKSSAVQMYWFSESPVDSAFRSPEALNDAHAAVQQ
jgi:hypothetical protein